MRTARINALGFPKAERKAQVQKWKARANFMRKKEKEQCALAKMYIQLMQESITAYKALEKK